MSAKTGISGNVSIKGLPVTSAIILQFVVSGAGVNTVTDAELAATTDFIFAGTYEV